MVMWGEHNALSRKIRCDSNGYKVRDSVTRLITKLRSLSIPSLDPNSGLAMTNLSFLSNLVTVAVLLMEC